MKSVTQLIAAREVLSFREIVGLFSSDPTYSRELANLLIGAATAGEFDTIDAGGPGLFMIDEGGGRPWSTTGARLMDGVKDLSGESLRQCFEYFINSHQLAAHRSAVQRFCAHRGIPLPALWAPKIATKSVRTNTGGRPAANRELIGPWFREQSAEVQALPNAQLAALYIVEHEAHSGKQESFRKTIAKLKRDSGKNRKIPGRK